MQFEVVDWGRVTDRAFAHPVRTEGLRTHPAWHVLARREVFYEFRERSTPRAVVAQDLLRLRGSLKNVIVGCCHLLAQRINTSHSVSSDGASARRRRLAYRHLAANTAEAALVFDSVAAGESNKREPEDRARAWLAAVKAHLRLQPVGVVRRDGKEALVVRKPR